MHIHVKYMAHLIAHAVTRTHYSDRWIIYLMHGNMSFVHKRCIVHAYIRTYTHAIQLYIAVHCCIACMQTQDYTYVHSDTNVCT